jgi:hypothetical protein
MAVSMGGHGQEAVMDSERDSNHAEQWFFLTMVLIVVAVVLRYVINKVETRHSGQNE